MSRCQKLFDLFSQLHAQRQLVLGYSNLKKEDFGMRKLIKGVVKQRIGKVIESIKWELPHEDEVLVRFAHHNQMPTDEHRLKKSFRSYESEDDGVHPAFYDPNTRWELDPSCVGMERQSGGLIMKMVNLEDDVTVAEAIKIWSEKGYRPATHRELYFFNWNRSGTDTLTAFGSFVVKDGVRHYAFIAHTGSDYAPWQCLWLNPIADDEELDSASPYLFVRKE